MGVMYEIHSSKSVITQVNGNTLKQLAEDIFKCKIKYYQEKGLTNLVYSNQKNAIDFLQTECNVSIEKIVL